MIMKTSGSQVDSPVAEGNRKEGGGRNFHSISDHLFRFLFFGGKIVTAVIDPPTPPRNWEGMGMGMGIDGEWQTCNDSRTIRECHSPNGKGNDHRCLYRPTFFFLSCRQQPAKQTRSVTNVKPDRKGIFSRMHGSLTCVVSLELLYRVQL